MVSVTHVLGCVGFDLDRCFYQSFDWIFYRAVFHSCSFLIFTFPAMKPRGRTPMFPSLEPYLHLYSIQGYRYGLLYARPWPIALTNWQEYVSPPRYPAL